MAYCWFDNYVPWSVLFCRLVPVIISLISIPAGMSGMNFPLFILLTTIGSLVWIVILVSLGVAVGDNWESIVNYMDVYSNIAYALLVMSGIAAVIWYIRFRRKRA